MIRTPPNPLRRSDGPGHSPPSRRQEQKTASQRAIGFGILQHMILQVEGPDSLLASALGRDVKGKLSPVFYLCAIPLAFWKPWVSELLYVLVALLWLVPDRRIERSFATTSKIH